MVVLDDWASIHDLNHYIYSALRIRSRKYHRSRDMRISVGMLHVKVS